MDEKNATEILLAPEWEDDEELEEEEDEYQEPLNPKASKYWFCIRG